MVFMFEVSFLGIMLFGWDWVLFLIYYFVIILVVIGVNFFIFWIFLVNFWLQIFVGGIFVDGKFVVQDYFVAIVNLFMVNSFLYMFFVILEIFMFVIGGISVWCIFIGC